MNRQIISKARYSLQDKFLPVLHPVPHIEFRRNMNCSIRWRGQLHSSTSEKSATPTGIGSHISPSQKILVTGKQGQGHCLYHE